MQVTKKICKERKRQRKGKEKWQNDRQEHFFIKLWATWE
jgi:hypothetical protein